MKVQNQRKYNDVCSVIKAAVLIRNGSFKKVVWEKLVKHVAINEIRSLLKPKVLKNM